MPIYEYLCPTCNRVFSFLAKVPGSDRKPTCPKCGEQDMKKMLSRFAVTGATRKSNPDGDEAAAPGKDADAHDPLDDPGVDREIMELLDAADGMDENDPRQLGRLMRRMSELTGEELDPETEEAVRRLEAGEDPEKIQAELDELSGNGSDRSGGSAPTYDEGLYPL
ncbi:MAG: zinc ribbon domain-containing protein [Kiritimatiellaeota bacterium]|nr:zinc ribbon domain-containing protein [Kiritimatiellota bacterium]